MLHVVPSSFRDFGCIFCFLFSVLNLIQTDLLSKCSGISSLRDKNKEFVFTVKLQDIKRSTAGCAAATWTYLENKGICW